MFNLKKSSFTFLILLISFSSVFARGKQDIIEEDSHVIDTYQAFSKENQNEKIEIVEIPVESNENETTEINLETSEETKEETNESESQFDITEENAKEADGITIIEVKRTNMPQKGVIYLTKTGEVFFSVIKM